MSVTLTNTSGRLRVFILPHDTYCQALGGCDCGFTLGRPVRRLPTSVTLPVGIAVRDLPDAVLAIAEIGTAIRRGELLARTTPDLPPPDEASPIALGGADPAQGGQGKPSRKSRKSTNAGGEA